VADEDQRHWHCERFHRKLKTPKFVPRVSVHPLSSRRCPYQCQVKVQWSKHDFNTLIIKMCNSRSFRWYYDITIDSLREIVAADTAGGEMGPYETSWVFSVLFTFLALVATADEPVQTAKVDVVVFVEESLLLLTLLTLNAVSVWVLLLSATSVRVELLPLSSD
jgi:hypothetical protein